MSKRHKKKKRDKRRKEEESRDVQLGSEEEGEDQLLPELFTAGGCDPVTGECWDGRVADDESDDEEE